MGAKHVAVTLLHRPMWLLCRMPSYVWAGIDVDMYISTSSMSSCGTQLQMTDKQ